MVSRTATPPPQFPSPLMGRSIMNPRHSPFCLLISRLGAQTKQFCYQGLGLIQRNCFISSISILIEFCTFFCIEIFFFQFFCNIDHFCLIKSIIAIDCLYHIRANKVCFVNQWNSLFGDREDLLVDLFNLGFVLSGKNVRGSFVEIFVKFKSLNTHFFFVYYNIIR